MKKLFFIIFSLWSVSAFGQSYGNHTTARFTSHDGIIVANTTSNITTVTDGTTGQVLTTDGAGGYTFEDIPAAISFGTDNQIPFVNVGGTDFDYSASFTWDGTSLLAGGTLTLPASSSLVRSGAHTMTLTTTGATNVTFPTTGTLATLAGTETLTNKTLTSPTISGSPTAAGATWTSLGTVTTADINGGTIDGTVIGGTTAAPGSFTALSANGNLTLTQSGTVAGEKRSVKFEVEDNTGLFSTTRIAVEKRGAAADRASSLHLYTTNAGSEIEALELGAAGNAIFSSTVSGAFNGTLGATTPSTVAATTLTTSGQAIIGTTSYSSTLDVTRSASSFQVASLKNSNATASNILYLHTPNAAGNSSNWFIRGDDSAGTKFLVSSAGDIQIGGTTAISSARAATLSAVRSTDLAGTGSDIVYADSDGDLVRSGVEISSVVTGPGSSTDNAVVRFNGTGGATLQNSGVTIDDSNNISGANNFTSGTYVPTFTGITNVTTGNITVNTAAGSDFWYYTRTHDMVTVHGLVQVTPTAAGQVTFRASIPIASTLNIVDEANGIIFFRDIIGQIGADAANNQPIFDYQSAAGAAITLKVNFVYQIN